MASLLPPPDPHETVLLTHATLVALTALIPLPFVDDLAKGYLQRRMVRALAERHRINVWDEEVRVLADDHATGGWFSGMARRLVFGQLKKVLRKTLLVLAGKRLVDLASRTYHHGWLVDRAFAHRWCAPAGSRSAEEVREAIDQVLAETPLATSPITRAISVGFERSQSALAEAYTELRERFGGTRSDKPTVERIMNDTGTGDIVGELWTALGEVPREHFEQLEERLRQRVAPEALDEAAGAAVA